MSEEKRNVALEAREPLEINAEYVREAINNKQFKRLKDELSELLPVDVAQVFDELPKNYYSTVYRLLGKEAAAEVFVELSRDARADIINSFTDKELSETLKELYLDDTVDIIEELPASVVMRIIRNSRREDRDAINQLLKFPKNTAGAVMTTEYVRLSADMTVEEALSHVREVAIDKETIYTCYVTDKKRRLIGTVSAKELLISRIDKSLSEIMEEGVIFANTLDDREEVARKLDKYGFLALPVVDAECRLVGIITIDDAIDVLKEETEEDFAKMAAIIPSEETYLKTGVFDIFKSRIPWLLLLMISATLSSTILARFESFLPAVLLLFVPMLMGTGGNSGSQSSVTIIRAISLGEARLSDFALILWKEVRVGFITGVVLGAVAFLKVYFLDGMLMNNGEVTLYVSFAVALAIAITVISAKLIGAVLPLLAKRIGLDPAVMASAFITTLIDVLSLLLYFAISTIVLGL